MINTPPRRPAARPVRLVLRAALHCALLGALVTAPVAAEDYVLTIGGGYSPSGNQVSIERNVIFFQRLLAEGELGSVPHDVYFSDGDNPGRDVQFRPADEEELSRAHLLMARLLGSKKYFGLRYRGHQVPGIRGGTSRENVEQWFAAEGRKLKAGDRLLLYVTAHGGKSRDKQNAHDTKIYLWNRQSIAASELARHLDKLPEGVEVVTIMVQCYAGGFAHLIFDEARADKGLSDRPRCGFFATVHDRTAAGCTADIDEENYQEYSSFFWAALRGRTRTDRPIERPDYDGDGRVSFDEAHAYTLLTSDTIDVPIKTSGAFLRKESRLAGDDRRPTRRGPSGRRRRPPVEKDDTAKDDTAKDDAAKGNGEKDDRDRSEADDTGRRPRLLGRDAPFKELASRATASERAVLDGLSALLELDGEDRIARARAAADKVQQQRKKLADERTGKQKRHDELKRKIAEKLKVRWPELSNLLNEQVTRLLREDSDQFIELVESHPAFSEWDRLADEIEQMTKERLDLERRWAKYQRLVRIAENVALAANLPNVASPQVAARYARMLEAEAGTFPVGERGAVNEPEEGRPPEPTSELEAE